MAGREDLGSSNFPSIRFDSVEENGNNISFTHHRNVVAVAVNENGEIAGIVLNQMQIIQLKEWLVSHGY